MQTVNVRFTGGALPMFGRALVSIVCTLLIVPAAWGSVPFVRWFIEHLEWSDGSQSSFDGEPGEVWYLFSLAGLIGFIPGIAQYQFGQGLAVSVGSSVVTGILTPLIAVPLWRWYTQHTRIGQTADLTFDGSVPGYIGYNLLVQVSFYTVIGWAWATVVLWRWVLSHMRSHEVSFEFAGSGLNILWRTFVMVLGCLFIIPIPWMVRWYIAWFVEQTVMQRTTASVPSSFDEQR